MNKERRKKLEKGIILLNDALDIMNEVLSEEEFAFDSLSEGLQQTMRGEQMEENIDILNDVIDGIENIIQDTTGIG